jgi:hemoglobin
MNSVPNPTEAVERAEDTPYARLGGDAAVRALVDRFYDLMDLEPGYARLRAVHGNELTHARDKLYWFLSGWLGGPNHYIERFGHPLVDQGVDEDLRLRLVQAFFQTADWMRNQPG